MEEKNPIQLNTHVWHGALVEPLGTCTRRTALCDCVSTICEHLLFQWDVPHVIIWLQYDLQVATLPIFN